MADRMNMEARNDPVPGSALPVRPGCGQPLRLEMLEPAAVGIKRGNVETDEGPNFDFLTLGFLDFSACGP